VPGIAICLVDQQVYTIGVAASDQSERGAIIAMFACEPTMREQLEAPASRSIMIKDSRISPPRCRRN
jgi:hypothetical protein